MNDDLKKHENRQGIKADDFGKYLNESSEFERNFIGELLKSRSSAWMIAKASCILTLFTFVALMIAIYRDPPTPVVLRVDNTTGSVEVLTSLNDFEVTQGEAVDRYWLSTYVLNRESYDSETIERHHRQIGLFSSPDVQNEYQELFEGERAIQKVLDDHTKILVNILSVALDPTTNVATIRFTTQEKSSNRRSVAKNFIATIAYKYVSASMGSQDRLLNPLGFQVTSYRVDREFTGQKEG